MQNYLQDSLDSICSISLHWSSDCNMACKYCYIDKDKKAMAGLNRQIRQALEDGSFAQNVKTVMASRRDFIENISLWGAEPTINSKFFKDFIYDMLDYFPNINSVMFSTNALLGAELIYQDFFLPLYNYAETHERKLKFDLQLSLDGPPEFNDESRHEGATKNTLETCYLLLEKSPPSARYFSLNIFSKATLDISYMRIMNARGIDSFNWYYQYFNNVQLTAMEKKGKKDYITLGMNALPTMVDPGYHTVEDGKSLAEWVNHLQYIDRTKLPAYQGMPLFIQPVQGLSVYFDQEYNPIAHEFNIFSCSASKNNITIDHEGNLYTCNRLCRNSALSDEYKYKHAMRSGTNMKTSDKKWLHKTWGSQSFHNDIMSRRYIFDQLAITMAIAGQIDKKYLYDDQARLLLFYCMTGSTCHIGAEEDYTQNPSLLPTSYFKLLGNGAIEALINYVKVELARKEIRGFGGL